MSSMREKAIDTLIKHDDILEPFIKSLHIIKGLRGISVAPDGWLEMDKILSRNYPLLIMSEPCHCELCHKWAITELLIEALPTLLTERDLDERIELLINLKEEINLKHTYNGKAEFLKDHQLELKAELAQRKREWIDKIKTIPKGFFNDEQENNEG